MSALLLKSTSADLMMCQVEAADQAGVIRVHDMNDLLTVARCLGVAPVAPKSGGRIAVMVFSGGAGVVAAGR